MLSTIVPRVLFFVPKLPYKSEKKGIVVVIKSPHELLGNSCFSGAIVCQLSFFTARFYSIIVEYSIIGGIFCGILLGHIKTN